MRHVTRDKPLGVFMCLPLALLGAIFGAFFGFLLLLLAFSFRRTDGQGGLMAIITGAPLGAVAGGVLGFRTARRLR